MKSVCICFVVLLFALAPGKVQAQFALNVSDATGNNYPMPVNYFKAKSFVPGFRFPWHSTDLFQIYERLDSLGCNTWLNTPYTHWNWSNTDLYQIWLKLDSCGIGGGGGVDSTAWHITGNSGTDTTTNFLGTTDSMSMNFKTVGRRWMNLGVNGKLALHSGFTKYTLAPSWCCSFIAANSVCIGDSAGGNLLYSSTDSLNAYNNVFIGPAAGRRAQYTYACTAIGAGALANDTGVWNASNDPFGAGYENTAVGAYSMSHNTSGVENTAIGVSSLPNNTTGSRNVAVGLTSLQNNTVGVDNTAVGVNAMFTNIDGTTCTAVGKAACYNCKSDGNTAIGAGAGQGITTTGPNEGQYNTAIGSGALNTGGIGSFNTALGLSAGGLANGGGHNVYLGAYAGWNNSSLDNRLYINHTSRGNITLDTTQSIIYGVMANDSSAQKLRVNAKLQISDGSQSAGKLFTCVDGNGIGTWNDYGVDTTANDSATINTYVGQFKVASGSATFTLLNSKILGLTTLTFFQSWNPTNSAHLHINSKSSGQVIIGFDPAPAADTKVEFQLRQ